MAVLLSFAAGNIGWSLPIATATSGGCCRVSGLATCCCGDNPGARSCGCKKQTLVVQREARAKLPSCCQRRLDEKKKSAPPAVSCACGESSIPGFVLSTQPKMTSVAASVPVLSPTADVAAIPAVALPAGNHSPETPPPRACVS
ncbi:MAG: hypothetical protein HY290_14900 [Planctomycetia bacterium]|nr:hypothetical protein [Planctomycetia bacterium]